MKQYTTAELKALGFTSTVLKILHPIRTKTIGIIGFGNGHKARAYTNVYAAWSIARDVTRDSETLEKFYKLLAKRGISISLIEGLEAEIAKALIPDYHCVYDGNDLYGG